MLGAEFGDGGCGTRETQRLTLEEIGGTVRLPVLYRGSVPDLFKVGRDVWLRGRLRGGVFDAVPGSLITKCPSKYAGKGTKE